MPEPIPQTWNAWTRIPPSKRWTLACSAPTEDEVREQLWALPWQGNRRDVCFLPENIDPNKRMSL